MSIRTKPRLVVVFDQDIKTDIVKELATLDIPVILFGTNSSFSAQISYSVPGNFFFVNRKLTNIVLFLICSIFKNTKSFLTRDSSVLPVLPKE